MKRRSWTSTRPRAALYVASPYSHLNSSVTHLQAYSRSAFGSSYPSSSRNSSNRSETGTDDTGRVWIQQPISPGRRASAVHGRTQPNVSNENAHRRSSSQDSASTGATYESNSTATGNGIWDGLEFDRPYRSVNFKGGGVTNGTSRGTAADRWVKQGGGHKKTVEAKAEEAFSRSQQEPPNQQRPKDDDSDSDSEFEM